MGKADSKREYQPHPRHSLESVGAEMEPMRNGMGSLEVWKLGYGKKKQEVHKLRTIATGEQDN